MLHPDNWTLLPDRIVMTPADWFTPYRKLWQDTSDMDLGGGGVVLIPNTNLLAASGKEGVLYLLDRNKLGKFDDDPLVTQCPAGYNDESTRDHVVDKLTIGTNRYVQQGFLQPCLAPPLHSGQWILWPHVHGTPVFGRFANLGDFLYVWPEKDALKSIRLTGTGFDHAVKAFISRRGEEVLAPPWKEGIVAQVGMPGGMLTLSIDPTRPGAGVLFASVQTCGDDQMWRACSVTLCKDAAYSGACVHQEHGILYAFDPITRKELWNNQTLTNDQQAAPWRYKYDFAKFVPPTIAKGKVFLATRSNGVIVYGRP